MEDINIYKFFLRVAKDSGNFQELKHNVLKRIKQRQTKITPKQYIEERIKTTGLIYAYSIILGQHSHINDLSIYITAQIGIDKSIELFENFITGNYGINTLNAFKNNLSEEFLIKQSQLLPKIPNQTGIKSLPLNTYLFYAFLWADSKERDCFWRSINEHWMKKCNEIIESYIEKQMEIYERNIEK